MNDILGYTMTCSINYDGVTKRVIFGDIERITKEGNIYTVFIKDRETGEENSIRLNRKAYIQLCDEKLLGKWNPLLSYCWSILVTNRYYEHREANARKKAERLEQERLEQERLEREGER